jgi:hypothetical protein
MGTCTKPGEIMCKLTAGTASDPFTAIALTRHSGPPKRPFKGCLGSSSCCYVSQSIVQC